MLIVGINVRLCATSRHSSNSAPISNIAPAKRLTISVIWWKRDEAVEGFLGDVVTGFQERCLGHAKLRRLKDKGLLLDDSELL